MLVLSDSGILIRLFQQGDVYHAAVNRAVAALRTRGDEPAYGFQNVTEFWNVSTRPATARGGLGLSLAEADRRLTRIETSFRYLVELRRVRRPWRQLVLTHRVQGKQVHDARLVALMQAHGITHILTLNGPDFARYPGITVIDPASFAIPGPPAPPPVTP